MNNPYQQHGYIAFRALQRTAYFLRSEEHNETAAQELDAIALRVREILHAANVRDDREPLTDITGCDV